MSTVVIPAFALFSYSLIFVAMTAGKKNKTVLWFMGMLVGFILFSAGSLLMRLMAWPGVDFWCKVSIGGMFLIPFLYYCFIAEFVKYRGFFQRRIFFFSMLLIEVLNFNGFLFSESSVVLSESGHAEFIFSAKWPIIIPVIHVFWVVYAIFKIIFHSIREKERTLNDYGPLLVGILALTLGTTLATIPAIGKFPLDTLAGIINAMCLAYMLYRQRLFKLTLVVSRGTAYALTALTIMAFMFNFIMPFENFMKRQSLFSAYSTQLMVVLFTLLTISIYFISKKFLDGIFARDENRQNRLLKEYSDAISRTIQLEELSKLLIQVIRENIGVEKMYLCLKQEETDCYKAVYSVNVLDSKELCIPADSPCISWLKVRQKSSTIYDFRHSVWYKSLWESEKEQFNQYQIECFVPLFSDDELVGVLALSYRENRARYSQQNLMFLDFIASISGMAIKNAYLYEMIYYKASHDNLTGLLNREFFFEKMEKIISEDQDESIALLLFNLDDFSLYNELYGREEGNRALQGMGNILKSATRNGLTARYGDKEFALLLKGADGKSARQVAEMLKDQLSRGFDETEDQWEKNLTVSVGLCVYPYAAGNLSELVNHTEMAVFTAKQNGKNQIVSYTMEEKAASENEEQAKRNDKQIYAQYANTIYALTAAIDVKDHYTFNHSNNVAQYATRLAIAVGLNDEHVELVREAALLHDIGKIGIPENILNKTSGLTDEEYIEIQRHVENSISIIRHLPSLNYVIPAVLGHHERWDGKGYPRRLKKEENPIAARCLAIADAYDAMTTKRSYRNPMSKAVALEEIRRNAGTQFDPQLAEVFVHIMSDEPSV